MIDSLLETIKVIADASHAGLRLDKFLSLQLPELSRNRIQNLIAEAHISVQGKAILERKRLVKPGEVFEIRLPPVQDSTMRPADIPLDIMYEDEYLLVLNKQAGLTTHPGAGNHSDTLANALLAHCGESLSGIGGVARPGIVHRLDKDTSGLMVAAKTDEAHRGLAAQIKDRSLKRIYLAFVTGKLEPIAGSISAPIGRHPVQRKKMAVVRAGKHAVTHYRVLEVFNNKASLVECRLETGRTHQIRVHLAYKNHPLIGDKTYAKGQFSLDFHRQALHSTTIAFTHPITGEWLEFSAPLPQDMQQLQEILTKY